MGGGLQLGAQWLNEKVNGIPILQNVVKPVCDLVDGGGAAVGDVFNGIGESWNDAGTAFEDLCDGNLKGFGEKAGDAVVDVAKGAVDGVKDAAKSVGNAIEDLFSW